MCVTGIESCSVQLNDAEQAGVEKVRLASAHKLLRYRRSDSLMGMRKANPAAADKQS